MWALNYYTKPKWELSNLKDHVSEGTKVMTTIGDYFTKMLDNSLSWKDVEVINKRYNLRIPESEEYKTIGGLILHYQEKIPIKDDMVNINNFRFKIMSVKENVIDEVELEVL